MRGLYLVTDRRLCKDKSVEEIVLQAVKGGVSYVQLREKEMSTHDFVEEALRIKKSLTPHKVPLIINDRVDVALACGADGVHIGQEDMPYDLARRLLGPKAIIGLSAETWEDVIASQALDVSYIGVSPVFATPTKRIRKVYGVWKVFPASRHSVVIRWWRSAVFMKPISGRSLKPEHRASRLFLRYVPRADPETAAGRLARLINAALK
jgi:thiamine-phosphate pyrophosphorylase